MERITVNPGICHGRPTVKGMRYPVEMIIELLASGMSNEQILDDYSDLEMEDIFAVLSYAARVIRVGYFDHL